MASSAVSSSSAAPGVGGREFLSPEHNAAVPLTDPDSLRGDVEPILEFFRTNTCYDFLPNSSEVVVVDIDLPLQHAFAVAQDNNVTFATLWDSTEGEKRLCGMLTITDYVKMLLHFRDDPEAMKRSWDLPIRTWYRQRAITAGRQYNVLVYCEVEDSLLEALRLLHHHKIHRLPALHNGNILHVICRPSVLGYFAANFPLDSKFFSYSVLDLKVGTFGRVWTGTPHTPLHTLLTTCMTKKVAALPITDEEGVLVDMFSRYDVMNIAAESDHNLDSTIAEINASFPTTCLYTCSKHDTLRAVLQHLMRTGAQRLVCVDGNHRVEGIVTVGDIFDLFIRYIVGPTDAPPPP
eukprot:RCo032193